MRHDPSVADEIEALVRRHKDAAARNDIDAVVSMMTDDVVLLTASGPPIIGIEAVRAQYLTFAGKFTIVSTARREDFTVTPHGDLALVVGIDSAMVTPVPTGPALQVSGPAVSVFRRNAEGWKLARAINLMAPSRT